MKENSIVIAINLRDDYNISITGFGDIYEVMSVEKLKRKLVRKYGEGVVYLASNKEHSGRGLSLDELEREPSCREIIVVDKGYVDTPPWTSSPRPPGDINRLVNNSLLVMLSRIVFSMILPLEPLWQGKGKSHMVYCFGKHGGK